MTKAKTRKGQAKDSAAPAAQSGDQGRAGGRKRKTLWGWVSDLLAAGIWCLLILGGVLGYFALDLPEVDDAVLTRRPSVSLLDAAGAEIARFGDIYGAAVDVGDLPFYVPAAVVAVEDRRFYSHFGVDLRGLARAMVVNLRAGGIVQGGSTITQQVAKNLFLTPERTLGRKIREMLLALWLERRFSKDQILTLYLNRVYLGAGAYGLEAAAETYFNRPARRLSVFQAAVVAGLLRAPSRYNPAVNPDLARQRATLVLDAMVDTGVLTAAQAKAALADASGTLTAAGAARPVERARYFADWIMGQVDDFVGAVDRDVVVRTTLDPALQQAAEAALRTRLDGAGAAVGATQGAIVLMDTDGAVRAMVGGRDYGESQFNRAVQALRQPGSAFKPFVFLAALESGYGPDDLVTDGPIVIAGWRPQNFSGAYQGPVTVERALADSINTATVRLAQQAGPRAVAGVARRLGIASDIPNELTIALGSAGVTLLELTGAYASFANGGRGVFPYAIAAITGRGGEGIYSRQGGGLGRVVAPDHVAAMNRMLAEAIASGTGKAAAFGYPAGGKTGTSQDFRDAWFIGFSADYVCGVWVGNDSDTGMKNVTGGGLPALIWRDVMAAAHAGRPRHDLPGLAPAAPDDFITRLLRAIAGD